MLLLRLLLLHILLDGVAGGTPLGAPFGESFLGEALGELLQRMRGAEFREGSVETRGGSILVVARGCKGASLTASGVRGVSGRWW